MKKLILLLLLIPSLLFAEDRLARMNLGIVGGGVVSGACTDANPSGNCIGFLTCQNSESCVDGTGDCDALATAQNVTLDNAELWTTTIGTNGTISSLDTTATILRETKQVKIFAGDAGETTSFTSQTFADQTEAYGFFRYKTDQLPATSGSYIFSFNHGATLRCTIGIAVTTNKLRCTQTGGTLSDGSALATGTKYYIWPHWKTGTGANAICEAWLSTTPTVPAGYPDTGQNCSSTDGTSNTEHVEKVLIQATRTQINYFDQILVKATPIGTVCE